MIELVNQFINFFRTFLSFAMVSETRLTACDTAESLILNCSPISLRCTDVYLCHKYCFSDPFVFYTILLTQNRLASRSCRTRVEVGRNVIAGHFLIWRLWKKCIYPAGGKHDFVRLVLIFVTVHGCRFTVHSFSKNYATIGVAHRCSHFYPDCNKSRITIICYWFQNSLVFSTVNRQL